MSNLSRRLLKEGLERVAKRGATMIKSEEINVGEVVHTLIKTVRSATGAGTQEPARRVIDKNQSLTETLLGVVRSVDSMHDLQARVKMHRGEFVDFARSSRHELVSVLSTLMEPVDHDHRGRVIPSSLRKSPGEDTEGAPPSKDV